MKKIYFIAASLFIGFGAMSQNVTKTLTSHFSGALANPQAPNVGAYTYQNNGGYVSGTNGDDDKAIVQLFDAEYGVGANGGTINSVKVAFAHKTGTTGNVKIGVWQNNGGNPGAQIQVVTVNLADIDTSSAGLMPILEGTTLKGFYNVSVNLTGAAIPSNGSFFAGVILPTTAAAGDTAVVYTTVPPYAFSDASTHAGVIGSDDVYYKYGVFAQLNIANAIFPEVTQNVAALSDLENNNALTVYPNPATDKLNFKVEGTDITSVKIYGMDGKLVVSENMYSATTSVNVAGLNTGMYIYEVAAANGATSKSTFIKK